MVPVALTRRLPSPIKHPASAVKRWLWRKRGLPAQSPVDISIMKELLLAVNSEEVRVFEWGTGASTVYYAEFLKDQLRKFDWYAVDNSAAWHQKVQGKIQRAGLNGQVHTACCQFPAFWQLPDYSVDRPMPPDAQTARSEVTDYVNFPKRLATKFDVVFIDGRYRRRCLLTAKEVLAEGGIVILHDAHRDHYHSSLAIYPHVQFLETGNITGRKQKSSIALCTLGDSPSVRGVVRKYGRGVDTSR